MSGPTDHFHEVVMGDQVTRMTKKLRAKGVMRPECQEACPQTTFDTRRRRTELEDQEGTRDGNTPSLNASIRLVPSANATSLARCDHQCTGPPLGSGVYCLPASALPTAGVLRPLGQRRSGIVAPPRASRMAARG